MQTVFTIIKGTMEKREGKELAESSTLRKYMNARAAYQIQVPQQQLGNLQIL